MKRLAMLVIALVMSAATLALATNVNVVNVDPGCVGGVCGAIMSQPSPGNLNVDLQPLQQIINDNHIVVPATIGASLNSGAVSTVGNVDITGTGITQNVSGSGTGTSSYDFSGLQTTQGTANTTAITNVSGDVSNLQTTVADHSTHLTTLDNGLAQEVIDRTNGDAVNAAAINNEASVRAGADSALGSAIGAETGRAQATEGALFSGLNAEGGARSAGDAALQNNINTVNSNSVARDGVLQGNIDKEASTRAAGDAALQNQVNGINARTADAERRIDRLEETKYLLEPTVRLYDSKRWQVQAFDSYDVRHGMNFALGARVMFKLGKSYEEKLIARSNPEIARLLSANVQQDASRLAKLEKQLADDRELMAEQAAALKALNARLSGLQAVDVNLAAQSGNDEDLLAAMEKRAEAR